MLCCFFCSHLTSQLDPILVHELELFEVSYVKAVHLIPDHPPIEAKKKSIPAAKFLGRIIVEGFKSAPFQLNSKRNSYQGSELKPANHPDLVITLLGPR